jgi:hypothetical protein
MSHSAFFATGAFAFTVNPFAMSLKLLQFNYISVYVGCQYESSPFGSVEKTAPTP